MNDKLYDDTTGYLTIKDGLSKRLPASDGLPATVHVFEKPHVDALNAALATGRPLLIRGEPGVGKSQLARAAAVALERVFVHQAVDSRTEPRDLLWSMDEVARLAAAQVAGVFAEGRKQEEVKADLAEERFIQPGALWWALNPITASRRCDPKSPQNAGLCSLAYHSADALKRGTVVLVDELDKADPAVPNAMLDALGQGGFAVPGVGRVHPPKGAALPDGVPGRALPRLIVITTNNVRRLPDAFLRRCLVLHMDLPEKDLAGWLVTRGKAHFDPAHDKVLKEAAARIVNTRRGWKRLEAPPGLAEYLDLVRAVVALGGTAGEQRARIDALQDLVLDKHPRERGG